MIPRLRLMIAAFYSLSDYKTVFLADNENQASFLPLFAAAKCNLHFQFRAASRPALTQVLFSPSKVFLASNRVFTESLARQNAPGARGGGRMRERNVAARSPKQRQDMTIWSGYPFHTVSTACDSDDHC
jgi:hypothetical protein